MSKQGKQGIGVPTSADAGKLPTFEPLEPRVLLAADLTTAIGPLGFVETDPGERQVLEITLSNDGNDRSGRSLLDIYAMPQDQPFDRNTAIPINTLRLPPLRPGASSTRRVAVTLPPTLPPDQYRFVAMIDSGNDVAESDETNNIAESFLFRTDQRDFDLESEVRGTRNVAPAVVAGEPRRSSIVVRITNTDDSTERAPRRAFVDVLVCARPVGAMDDSQDILLNRRDIRTAVSGIRPGGGKNIRVPIEFPAGLNEGDYNIVVKVDPDNELNDTDESDTETMFEGMVITVADPFVDLDIVYHPNTNLPNAVVSGDQTPLNLRVTIGNNGNVPTERGERASIGVYAVDTATQAMTLIDTFDNINVGGLQPGANRNLNLRSSLPPGLEGTFDIKLMVDSNDVVAESDENNNDANSATSIIVAEGFVDIVPEVVGSTLPPAVVSGDGSSGRVTVDVFNRGNVRFPAGQCVDIIVALRPVGGGADVEIGRVDGRGVGNLVPDRSVRQAVNVNVPGALAEGEYQVVVTVNPSAKTPLMEDGGNNEVVDGTIDVAEGFVDLVPDVVGNNLPPAVVSGDGTSGNVTVDIDNNGNIRVPANTTVDVVVLLRAMGGMETEIGRATRNVGGVNPGASVRQRVNVTVPGALAEGEYDTIVRIEPSPQNVENAEDQGNNEVVDGTIDVAEGFVDLVPDVVSNNLPPAVVSGDGTSGTVTVDIDNNGNIRVPANTSVDIIVALRPVGGGMETEIGRVDGRNVSGINPGASVRQNVNVTVPGALADGDYDTIVRIEPSPQNVENAEDRGNNEVADTPINVAEGFFDLLAEYTDGLNLPQMVVSGDGTNLALPIRVTNNGNLRTPNGTIVDIDVEAVNGGPTMLGTFDGFNVGGLNPGQSRTFNINTTILQGVQGMVDIIAHVDASDRLDESDDVANNAAASPTPIDVQLGFVDLVPSVFNNPLPPAAVSGAGANAVLSIDVDNDGNVNVPAGTTADIIASLRPTGGGAKTEIGRVDGRSVGNLPPGGTNRTNVNVTVPGALADGDYELVIDIVTQLDQETNNDEVVGDPINIAAGFFDLVAAYGAALNLPANVVSGDGTNLALPVEVTNNGNLPIPNGTLIDINVDAVNGTTHDLGTFNGFDVGGMTPGSTRTFNVNTMLPAGLDGDFNIKSTIDFSDVLDESDDVTNNMVTSLQLINVAEGFFDIRPVSIDDDLNASIVAGSPQADGMMFLSVLNDGNLDLPNGQLVDVVVTITPIGGGEPIEIGRLDGTSVSGLAANGGLIQKVVDINVGPNTPEDDYTFDVTVTPSAGTPLAESDVMNNTTSSGALSVDPAMNDIFPTNFAEDFAANIIAGQDGSATFSLRNNGNVPLPAGQMVDFEVFLRPDMGGNDVSIGTLLGFDAGGLEPGMLIDNIMIDLMVPGATAADTYTFVIVATPSAGTPLNEVDVDNNERVSIAQVNVADAFVDLALLLTQTTLGSQREGGDMATANVTLANGGNVAITGDVLIEVFFTVSGDPDTDGVLLGSDNQAINVAAGGVQALPNFDLTVPFVMEQMVGDIVARITPSNLSMADQDTDDYEQTLVGQQLTIVPTIPFVGDIIGNLSFDTETLYLPTNVPGFGLITASAQGEANSDTNYNTGYQYNVNYQQLQSQAIINLFPDGTIDGGHTIAPQWVLTLDFFNAGLRPDHIVGHTIRIVETNGAGVDGMATISGLLLNGVAQPDETFFFTFD